MREQIIVVTGAAGCIGSGVVRQLNDQGFTRLLLVDDIEQTDKWKNLLGKKFENFISKYALFDWLKDHINEVGGIIHMGACSDTLETDGNYLMENNFHYTQKLAKVAVNHEVRFIYASSAATYGDGHLGFSDDPDLLDELRPLNLYAFSKHLFDQWAKQQGLLDQIVGLKYFNVFGPNEHHKGHMASMVYKMWPKVKDQGRVELFKSADERFGDGEQCRDFLYVKDAAKMTVDLLQKPTINGIYNMGSGKTTTWNQLAKALFKASKREENINYIPMPEGLAKQYQNYTCADMSRYLTAQGLQRLPHCSIDEAVEDYVQNYLVEGRTW